jgi:hypothetical protein
MRRVFVAIAVALCATASFSEARAQGDCPQGYEQDGAVCYPRCKEGYEGKGPVCWQRCPDGFPDRGLVCGKRNYSRGAGYALWDKGKCQREHGSCELSGAVYYPKCRPGFRPVGCCDCWPDCPSGMKDTGAQCEKRRYDRGPGKPLESVRKAFEETGKKIKSGFEEFGKMLKEKVLDEMKKFGMKLFNAIKDKVSSVVSDFIVSLTARVGFNEDDAQKIVDPRTGMYDKGKLQEVVVRKLLRQYLQPLIKDKLLLLIDKGLEFIQKPLDAAVSGVIGGLGSIPFAGGAIAAAVSVAYSLGMKWLREFAANKISEFATNKLITPLVNGGLDALKKLGKPVENAINKLFERSEQFFKNWIRHPDKIQKIK